MIAVDANILIYSHRRDSPFHERARAAMMRLAEGDRPWGIPWPCLHEFYAIATHPRLYKPASTPDEAVTQMDIWLNAPAADGGSVSFGPASKLGATFWTVTVDP